MIGFIIAIILFNTIALLTTKKLSLNQIIHIWLFTVSLQSLVDLYVDLKFHGYWYFKKEIDWAAIPSIVLLVPPVNIIFLNWFPYQSSLQKRIVYLAIWYIMILVYEMIALLPEPWGYFHYGWWHLGISAIVDPFLLLSLVLFYKWICKIERLANQNPTK